MKKGYTIREKIIMLFTAIFVIFSLIVLGNIIFNNTTLFNVTKPLLIVTFIIGYLFVIFLLYKILKKDKKKLLDKKILIIAIIFILLITIQVIYAYNSYTEYGWDCGKVLETAEKLLTNHEFDSIYYSQYYNNIFIVLFFKNLYLLCSILGINNFLFASIMVNILIIDASIFLIYLVSKKMFGDYGGFVSFIFSIPILGLSPWMIVPYTDTFSMIFPILLFYIYLLIKEQKSIYKKYILAFLLGTIIILGMLIKPTVIIIGISLIIVEIFLKNWKEKNKKEIAILALIIIVSMLLTKGITDLYKNVELKDFLSEEKSEQLEIPMTHFIMMGLSKYETADGKCAYGVYNDEDASNTASYDGKQNKISYNIKEIKVRLKDMEISGYIKFAYNKLNWILCDGSFFYGGEGNFHASAPFASGKVANIIQSFSYVNSEYYYVYQSFLQAMWIMVQIFIVLSMVLIKENWKDKNLTIVRMTIFGICLFIVLFEGRSRYLINHLPIFILLATYSFINIKREKEALVEMINKIKIKYITKNEK